MLGTFPGTFPKRQLPKGIFPMSHFLILSQPQSTKYHSPPSHSAQPPFYPFGSCRLGNSTFRKMPLGKLSLGKLPLGKMPFGK